MIIGYAFFVMISPKRYGTVSFWKAYIGYNFVAKNQDGHLSES